MPYFVKENSDYAYSQKQLENLALIGDHLYSLFEYVVNKHAINDEESRKILVRVLTNHLNGMKIRKEVQEFYVKCDEENNGPVVYVHGDLHTEVFIKLDEEKEFTLLKMFARYSEY